jgi:predicted enzyme related to lactoylglutathione lyase
MNFTSVRIITSDIKRLVGFYESVTRIPARWYTEEFAEIGTKKATLALGSVKTMNLFGNGLNEPGVNNNSIIEFQVDNVDEVFERIENFTSDIVQKPTTMPWGNRSLLFRDPDGNLVNFFTPVSPEAIQKFS